MSINPVWFPLTNALGVKKGDRVRYSGRGGSGEGAVTLVWLGIEECVDVERDGGGTVHLFLALGDSIEVVHPPRAKCRT